MPQSLALSDLVVPYVLRAEDLGANHAILSVLRVESFESAADSLGTVIRGRASFQGSLRIDPAAAGDIERIAIRQGEGESGRWRCASHAAG